jgi:hypothetical protein
MKKTTLLPHLIPPIYEGLRLTLPAKELLERAGNTVEKTDKYYTLMLRYPPANVRVVIAEIMGEQSLALRCEGEPQFPCEYPAAWHDVGLFTACPECGAALMWCEAGYVPGWRICLAGHANQLSSDGKTSKRMPRHDEATLATLAHTRPL